MSSILNWHLFYLVLMVVPFRFSTLIGRTAAAPASGVPDFGTSSIGSLLDSITSVSSAAATAFLLPRDSSVIDSQSLTQLTSSVSVSTISVTPSGVFPASPTPDPGAEYGNIIINDNCTEGFNILSVGANKVEGNRTEPAGNGTWITWVDTIVHDLPSGGSFTQAFRITCSFLQNVTDKYCEELDKQRGQGVAIKIFRAASPSEILQYEYALVQNPLDNLSYALFHDDMSTLDCGDPAKYPQLYGNRTITNVDISPQDMQHKIDICPVLRYGYTLHYKPYQGYETSFCEPIDCDGTLETPCLMYYFGRTYTNCNGIRGRG